MPTDDKTGRKVQCIQNKDAICLTENEANYVYKKVEQGNFINTETMKQEIELMKLTEIDTKDDNPYKRVTLNKVYWDEEKNDTNGKLVNSK